ncbi:preprotein translocase subunit YajC [Glutamicibacter sp. MNS18]|uniref:preprotein translocase subunit YajC n=1 Tax=Glutamicibacter sp. MNS18 TaxID=2989817 RepID=UPI002235760C|nr:preprotein translocase subunit YajC [Glutamicibacter sp. MNS18]MCW4464770.1 preprotein translocase subunit YajC [Glutamicibacter sp. MNS18]
MARALTYSKVAAGHAFFKVDLLAGKYVYSVTIAQAAGGGFNPSLILMVGLFAVLILMMIRGRKKVSKQQETLKEKTVPGAKVMTNSGIFGTVLRIDEQDRIELEVAPGVVLTVHRQAIAQFIDPEVVTEEPTAAAETPEESLRRLDGEGKDERNN